MDTEDSPKNPKNQIIRRIDGTKTISVSSDTTCLRESRGFWSGNQVFYNPSNSIVLLRPVSADDVRDCVKSTLDATLESAVYDRIRSLSRTMLLHYFTFEHLPSFQDARYRVRGHASRSVQVDKVLEALEESYPEDEEQQKRTLVAEICSAYNQGKPVIAPIHIGADSLTALAHPGLRQVMSKKNSGDDLIASLSVISRYNTTWQKKHTDKEQIALIHKSNAPAVAEMQRFGLDTETTGAAWTISLVAAVRMLLAVLVRSKVMLLPSDYFGMGPSMRALRPDFFEAIKTKHQYWMSMLLASSTLDSVADIPADFHQWVDGMPNQVNTNAALSPLIENYQRLHGLSAWPLGGLHRNKSTVNRPSRAWTLPWIANQGFSAEWVAFSKLALDSSSAGPSHKGSVLRLLLEWAKERSIPRPDMILVSDLYDAGNPKRQDTFAAFLTRTQESNPYDGWIRVAGLFRRIYNNIKIIIDPGFALPTDPFELLDPPFRVRRKNKTPRRRLPTNIHEAIIEVLLEPDKDGNPTYRWVREGLGWDWYESEVPVHGREERVWCPSRSACLALLLILPFRSKQARWLDRGLMDTHVWNVGNSEWVPNDHPLAAFKYPNGEFHVDRYGRNSGVLQPIFDALTEGEQLGIFVNSNKTQMWDPQKCTGYEVPWPDCRAIASQAPDMQESLIWLDRPYKVLRQQLAWQTQFNPNPLPVGFMDSSYDESLVDERFAGDLPLFCPVFADLGATFYRDDQSDAKIHLPVPRERLQKLFNALAVETESRLKSQGSQISITQESESKMAYNGRVSIFDLHALRVAGISRLIEMGVPAHIVQEYVVGHAAVVMTYHYTKYEQDYLTRCLLSATPPEETLLLGDWEALRPELAMKSSLWISHPRYANHRPEGILDVYTGWKLVSGGICPVGGQGCDEGQPLDIQQDRRADDRADANADYGPVQGGCGNCRYFSTGPAFLVHQAQATNEIMLAMRAFGEQRNLLYRQLTEVNRSDVPDLDPKTLRKIELKRRMLKDQIEEIDLRLEPMILEWINRYHMFKESKKISGEWRKFVDSHGDLRRSDTDLVLISGIDGLDLQADLEVRLKKASDFTLVRSILEGAKLRGGLAKASSIAKKQIWAFVDRILRAENSRHLLLDVRDDEQRTEAAFQMATLASRLVGDDAVDRAINNGEPLPLDSEQRESWLTWTAKIVAESAMVAPDALFVPILRNSRSGQGDAHE